MSATTASHDIDEEIRSVETELAEEEENKSSMDHIVGYFEEKFIKNPGDSVNLPCTDFQNANGILFDEILIRKEKNYLPKIGQYSCFIEKYPMHFTGPVYVNQWGSTIREALNKAIDELNVWETCTQCLQYNKHGLIKDICMKCLLNNAIIEKISLEKKFKCVICDSMTLNANKITLPCKHNEICKTCLIKVFINTHEHCDESLHPTANCPLCRHPFTESVFEKET
jgi:hypothetical protein